MSKGKAVARIQCGGEERAKGRASVLLCLFCSPNNKQRGTLAYLKAEPASRPAGMAGSWYLVRLGERTIAHVQAILSRSFGPVAISEGWEDRRDTGHATAMLYWGAGRECRATGQTKEPGSHSEGRHH